MSDLHKCCYCGAFRHVPSFVADHEREDHIDTGEPEKACGHVAIRKRRSAPLVPVRPQHDTSHTPEPQTRVQRF